MSKERSPSVRPTSSRQEIEAFIEQVNRTPAVITPGQQGRLLFALDATLSRQPTWDHACHLQSEMFLATRDIGGLLIQLCYYRGFGEFETTPWLADSQALLERMNGVSCKAGHTQIERVLYHALSETRTKKVQAVVFIGDCVEEDVKRLCALAGELGMLGTPVFMFQEGNELVAKRTYKQIAQLSGGAYSSFDNASAKVLKDLLAAVAVYASGGRRALEDFAQRKQGEVLRLTRQLSR